MTFTRRMAAVAIAIGTAGCASFEAAPPYPTKPVQIVVPYPAGNTVDVFGRIVAEKLSQLWGQPVNVENRPGIPSIDAVAKSAPDGYTLLVHGMPFALDAALYTRLPYDPQKDFVAIAPFATQPFALVASPSLGVKSVAELVAAAKARPGQLRFASYGPTNQLYFLAEQFRKRTGVDASNVTVAGLVEGNAAVAQGRVGFWFAPIAGTMPGIRDGKLVPLAVTGEKRSAMLPQVPTMAEAGVAGMGNAAAWFGMWGPAGMPKALVDKIGRDVARAMESPDVREKFARAGAEPLVMSPAQFSSFVLEQTEASRRFIRELGIPPQPYASPAGR